MAGQSVIVSVLADTKRFSRSMQNLGNETGFTKLTNGVKKFSKALAIGAGAVVGLTVAWGAQSVKSLARIEQIGAQTDAVLKSTAGASGRTREQIDKLAGSIEDMSGVEAETTTMGQNLLATFTNIKGTNFDRATQAMVDMGVAMNNGSVVGLDFKSTSVQVGKALNDPIKGITALSKVGVSFTDQQKEMIKTMVETGDTAGAQTIILDELAKEFGGSAAAAGQTTIGKWERVKHAFGTLGETIFAKALPAVSGMTDFLIAKGIPAFNTFGEWVGEKVVPKLEAFGAWIESKGKPLVSQLGGVMTTTIIPALKNTAGWVKDSLIPALGDFGEWLKTNKGYLAAIATALTTFVTGIAAYLKVMAIWRAVTVAAAAAQVLFNTAMTANPIGLIVLAVASLVAGLTYFLTQTTLGQQIVTTAWAAIQTAVGAVVTWFQTSVLPILQTVWAGISAAAQAVADYYTVNIAPVFAAFGNFISALVNRIASIFSWLWKAVQPILFLLQAGWSLLWNGVKSAWMVVGPPLMALIAGAFRNIQIVLGGVWNAIQIAVSTAFNIIKTVITTALGIIKGIFNTAAAVLRGDWSGAWEGIKGIVSTAVNGMVNILASLGSMVWNQLVNVINTASSAMSNVGTTLVNAGKKLIGGFIDGIKNAIGGVKDTLGGLTSKLTSWKGPPERDATLLKGAGQLVIGGFVDGLKSRFQLVRKTLGNVTDLVGNTTMPTIEADVQVKPRSASPLLVSAAQSSATLASAAVSRTYNITVQTLDATAEVGRKIVDAIREYDQINGVRT